MTPSESKVIAAQLATLAEQVAGVRRDIERQDQTSAEEIESSHQSRRELHEKVNGVLQDIALVKGDIRVAAEVTAQTRETVKVLSRAFEDAAPTIAQMEQAKRVGLWVIGGGGLAVIGAVAAALAFGETVKAWLAHWLGIK